MTFTKVKIDVITMEGKYKQKIIERIKSNKAKKKETNLAELKKLGKQHQPILYNVRRMLSNGTIKPYINSSWQCT